MTDREQMVAAREADRLEAQAVDYAQNSTAVGVGLAAMALAMLHALLTEEEITRDEALALVQAALAGR